MLSQSVGTLSLGGGCFDGSSLHLNLCVAKIESGIVFILLRPILESSAARCSTNKVGVTNFSCDLRT